VPDEEKCGAFFLAQKNVAEKNYTKALAPTAIFRSPSNPKGLRSCYRVINEVRH